jgi:hypothetical protein
MNKTIKNHKVNFSPSKVLNRNKIIGGNLLNDAFTNIYLDGSSSSISSVNISSNYLSSKKNEKGLFKTNSMKHYPSLNKLNLSGLTKFNKTSLKYLPKNKMHFPKMKSIPLVFQKQNNNISLQLSKSLFLLEKGVNESDKLKFKNENKVKIIKIMDKYFKLKNKYTECLSNDKNSLINDLYNSLKKYNNEFIELLFDDLGDNLNFILWKKIIIYISENIISHYKILDCYLSELSSIKKKNNILNIKNQIQKYEIENNTVKITKMNEILKENQKALTDRNNVYKNLNDEESKKLNENLTTIEIFKLKSEINDLTTLLNKNKEYFQKYLDLKEELEQKKIYINELNDLFHKMKIKMNVKIDYLNNYKIDFEKKISKLTEENNQSFQDIEIKDKIIINDKTEIQKLKFLIETYSERLYMINEEMSSWIIMYQEEKKEHNKTKKTLESLENLIRVIEDK